MTDFILGPTPGEDNAIMPLGQVHMIGGGSGAGKTTFVFQLLQAMQKGEDFFGMPTQNHPTVYLTFDRTAEETKTTLQRVFGHVPNLEIMECRIEAPPRGATTDHRLDAVLSKARATYPDAKVFIIDAVHVLVPFGNINDYLTVGTWAQTLRDWTAKTGAAIVGITHSPKQREGSRILEPRQMLLGSVAGAGFTSCGIIITRDKPETEDRTVHFLPRNAAEFHVKVGLDQHGRLTEDSRDVDDRGFYVWQSGISKIDPGVIFSLNDLQPIAEQGRISKPALYQLIQGFIKQGKVVKVAHGKYYRPLSESQESKPPEVQAMGGLDAQA